MRVAVLMQEEPEAAAYLIVTKMRTEFMSVVLPAGADTSNCCCAEAPVTNAIPRPEEPTRELYSVPACSAWFHYNRIGSQERRAVPEFFNGQSQDKTPDVRPAARPHGHLNLMQLSSLLPWRV